MSRAEQAEPTPEARTRSTASDTASRIESAIVTGGSEALQQEVRQSTIGQGPQGYAQIAEATRQMERSGLLPQVIGLQAENMFAATNAWSKENWGNWGLTNRDLTKADIEAYARRPGVTPLEKELARRVTANFESISQGDAGISRADLDKFLGEAKKQASLREFFKRDKDGRSLYSDVADKDGNIQPGALNKRLEDKTLTPAQRQALEHMKSEMTTFRSLVPGTNDMTRSHVEALAKGAGLDPKDVDRRMDNAKAIAEKREKEAGETPEQKAQKKAAMTELFKQDRNGRSLYSDLIDKDGNIKPGAINEKLNDPKLTDAQRKALQHLQNEQTFLRKYVPGTNDMTKDHVRELAVNAGLDAKDVDRRMEAARQAAEKREKGAQPPEAPETPEKKAERKAAMKELFKRDKNGRSLYGDLIDGEGNVKPGAINERLQDPKLSPQQKKALEHLQKEQTFLRKYVPGTNDMTKDHVRELAQKAGLDPKDTDRRMSDAMAAAKKREAQQPPQEKKGPTDAEHRREAVQLLRRRDQNGQSVLSDVMDKDGNVSWEMVKKEKMRKDITPEKKAALEWLDGKFKPLEKAMSPERVLEVVGATGYDGNDARRRIEDAQRIAKIRKRAA